MCGEEGRDQENKASDLGYPKNRSCETEVRKRGSIRILLCDGRGQVSLFRTETVHESWSVGQLDVGVGGGVGFGWLLRIRRREIQGSAKSVSH